MRRALGALTVGLALGPAGCMLLLGPTDVPTPEDGGPDGAADREDVATRAETSVDRMEVRDHVVSCAVSEDASSAEEDSWAREAESDSAPPCGELGSGQALSLGQTAYSCDGRFSLTMQPDGNLVLSLGASSLWAAGTTQSHGVIAVMQADGNLVVANVSGSPVWSSGTYGYVGALLKIQNDGNLVIACGSEPIWSTGTCCR
jgi:hypothetical protein